MGNKVTYPGNKGIWHGYDSYCFEIDGVESIIVTADSPLKGNPWIWRARFFNADPSIDLAMLRHGVHLVHTNISDLAGGPEAMRRMNKFYKYLTEEIHFSETPILESYSRGALPALNWAIRNPEKTAMLILDSPLCNFKSWPKTKREKEICRKAGVLNEDYSIIPEWNPVDNLAPLIENKIPVAVLYEESDKVIPIEDNAKLILTHLKENGGDGRAFSGKQTFTDDDIEDLTRSAIRAWEK